MLLIIAETIFAVATIVLSPVPCMGLSALHCLRTDDGAPTSPVQEAPKLRAAEFQSSIHPDFFASRAEGRATGKEYPYSETGK